MDATDTALASVTAVSLALCCIGTLVYVWRGRTGLKPSRSDPDLESLQNIVTDSLPTHK